jgi:hypothetical protein
MGLDMTIKSLPLVAILACALGVVAAPQARAADAGIDCKLHYSLTGWSLIYKHTSGRGRVTCSNGQSMRVLLSAKAVGLTAGKWHIDNGTGKFTDVHSIRDVLGGYAQASANAGVAKTGEAQVLTNGSVSLALAGKGEGVNIGVDVGQLRIKPAR